METEHGEPYGESTWDEVREHDEGWRERTQKWGPCFMGALAVEFLVFGAMAMVEWSSIPLRTDVVTVIAPEQEMIPPMEKKPEPDLEEVLREIEKEKKIEDPVEMPDVEVAEENRTDDDEPFETAKGNPELKSMVDFRFLDAADLLGVSGPIGGRFGHRGPGSRVNSARNNGGSRYTEDAVRGGLEWLKRHQSPDGSWSADGFSRNCDRGKCSGPGDPRWTVGLTGLALEAFLGHGQTHRSGDYRTTVAAALNRLLRSQQVDGLFGERVDHYMYNHALATYAVAEAYGMTEDPKLKAPVEKAVRFLLDAQNLGMAWRYRNYNRESGPEEEGGRNDVSVTGWVIMALKAAKVAGVEIPDSAFEGANRFIDSVQSAHEYGATFGYYAPDTFVHKQPYVSTAAGVLVRQFTGNGKGVDGGISVLMDHLPKWERVNLYEWYYSTLVIFQQGGANWRTWNDALKPALLDHQWKGEEHCEEGSWDPEGDPWGSAGGRVYSTATGALCLEIYYRYERLNR